RAIQKIRKVVEIDFSPRKRMEEEINVVANKITAKADRMLSVCPREHVRSLKILSGGPLIAQWGGTQGEQAVHFDGGHAGILGGQRVDDTELRVGERLLRRGRRVDAAEPEVRFVDEVGAKHLCVGKAENA